MNWAATDLSMVAFKNRNIAEEDVEEELAYDNKKTFDFYVKWENLKQLLV